MPAEVDVGSGPVGASSAEATVTVVNVGRVAVGSITARLVGLDPTEFAITSPPCASLAIGASCALRVALRPRTAGPKQAVLQVSSTPGGTATAEPFGRGQTPAALSISPSFHDYGLVAAGAMTGPVRFTVRNVGQVAVPMLSPLLVPRMGNQSFLFTAGTCSGATLAPGASCTLDVQGRPAAGETSGAIRTSDLVVTAANSATAVAGLRLVIQ